jgi:hypothetical protein
VSILHQIDIRKGLSALNFGAGFTILFLDISDKSPRFQRDTWTSRTAETAAVQSHEP